MESRARLRRSTAAAIAAVLFVAASPAQAPPALLFLIGLVAALLGMTMTNIEGVPTVGILTDGEGGR